MMRRNCHALAGLLVVSLLAGCVSFPVPKVKNAEVWVGNTLTLRVDAIVGKCDRMVSNKDIWKPAANAWECLFVLIHDDDDDDGNAAADSGDSADEDDKFIARKGTKVRVSSIRAVHAIDADYYTFVRIPGYAGAVIVDREKLRTFFGVWVKD